MELLTVIADVATCWNSIYSMIERAMKLKDLLDLFATWHSDNVKLDQLTPDD